jgi:hypothetical protein
MEQTSFASAENAGEKRQTGHERFLGEMNAVVPWLAIQAVLKRSGRAIADTSYGQLRAVMHRSQL